MKRLIISTLLLFSFSTYAGHCSPNATTEQLYLNLALEQIQERCPITFNEEELKVIKVIISSWDTEQYYTFTIGNEDETPFFRIEIEGECRGGYQEPSLGSFTSLVLCE